MVITRCTSDTEKVKINIDKPLAIWYTDSVMKGVASGECKPSEQNQDYLLINPLQYGVNLEKRILCCSYVVKTPLTSR